MNQKTAGLSALVLLICISSISWAEATPPDDRTKVVMIAGKNQEKTMLEVIRVVKAQLSDLHVDFSVEWTSNTVGDLPIDMDSASKIAAHKDVVVVFWCDVRRADEVYLYISDAGQKRILVRRLDGVEEGVWFESLAVIVRDVIEALLLHDGEIGVKVKLPPPPPKEPKKPANENDVKTEQDKKPKVSSRESNKETFRIGAEIGYMLGLHSSQHLLVHSLYVGIMSLFFERLNVITGYVVRGPIKVDDEVASIDIQNHPAILGLGYAWNIGRFRLGGALTVIGDYAVQRTRAVGSKSAVKRNNSNFLVSLYPLLDAMFMLNERFEIHFSVGGQYTVKNIYYVADNRTRDGKIIDKPWKVTPHVLLSLVFVPYTKKNGSK
ncbi:MAG: hypothetical protein GY847_29775 [Proteobacteria bacterium]|nr:hypothetical protein [Pseudomonadota bacterium]